MALSSTPSLSVKAKSWADALRGSDKPRSERCNQRVHSSCHTVFSARSWTCQQRLWRLHLDKTKITYRKRSIRESTARRGGLIALLHWPPDSALFQTGNSISRRGRCRRDGRRKRTAYLLIYFFDWPTYPILSLPPTCSFLARFHRTPILLSLLACSVTSLDRQRI